MLVSYHSAFVISYHSYFVLCSFRTIVLSSFRTMLVSYHSAFVISYHIHFVSTFYHDIWSGEKIVKISIAYLLFVFTELAEQRRNNLLEIFRRIGIIMLSISFLLSIMGLTAILFVTVRPEFTFATGVPLIIGILVSRRLYFLVLVVFPCTIIILCTPLLQIS